MRRVAGAALLALGLAQMAGDLLRVPALKGLAAATCASPAPKVFSSVEGLETFSTRFYLNDTLITPELYGRLEGPYNRRNVYGAILAFGPVLKSNPRTQPMFDAVLSASLCGDRPLLRELGLSLADPVSVRLVLREGSKLSGKPLVLEAACP